MSKKDSKPKDKAEKQEPKNEKPVTQPPVPVGPKDVNTTEFITQDFTEEMCRDAIRAAVNEAHRIERDEPGKVKTDPKTDCRYVEIEIDVRATRVDTDYQRPISYSNVQQLIDNFNLLLMDPLLVSYRDGGIQVINGGHRRVATIVVGHYSVSCRFILDMLTAEDEAVLFHGQHRCTKKTSPRDEFRSGLKGNLDGYPEIFAVCREYKVQPRIENPGFVYERPLSGLSAIKRYYDLSQKKGLRWMFDTLDEAGWLQNKKRCSGCLTSVYINAFSSLYYDAELKNELDVCKAKLATFLRHTEPNRLLNYACNKYDSHDARNSLGDLLNDIRKDKESIRNINR